MITYNSQVLNKLDIIMDVGCGRGRLFNFLLSKRFIGEMYGVEIDPEIGIFTRNRLRRYSNINIFVGNALDFVLLEVTVYFLFCPFNRVITEKFITEIEKKHMNVKIIYYYPKYVYCILSRKGWTGIQVDIYSSIRNFSLPCFFLQYQRNG